MTTPDVPLRMELTFELPGTPEQVWDAIATARGITAWFLPTDVDEREGGAVVTHMGDVSSPGNITGWEPPHRFAYEEPDWAGLVGREGAPVTPLATEFLVEATSGGTCVVRVVTSAFGTGADWEQEFFDGMEEGWAPHFDLLRIYLERFPGQQAATVELSAPMPGDGDRAWDAVHRAATGSGSGADVAVPGITATVLREGRHLLLASVAEPTEGYLALFAFDGGDGNTVAVLRVYLFGATAGTVAERERPAWQQWLDGIAATVG